MQAEDSASLAGPTPGFRAQCPLNLYYVDVVPRDLARIVVEALRRDLLSPYQTMSIFEAAREAPWGQENG